MSLSAVLIVILLSISLINALVLILKPVKNAIVKNGYIGVTLFIYSLFYLSYYLWFKLEIILDFPHLLRVINPLMFLAMPFFYFFIRNTLMHQTGFQKYDWVHVLPALFHVIELYPLYSLDSDQKLIVIQKIIEKPELIDELANGYIPGIYIDAFRMVLQLFYFGFAVKLLFAYQPSFFSTIKTNMLKNWLFVSVFLIGFLLFFHLFYFFVPVLNLLESSFIELFYKYMPWILISPLVLLNIYLRINPETVYLSHSEQNSNESMNQIHTNSFITEENMVEKDDSKIPKMVLEGEEKSTIAGINELDLLTAKNRIIYLLNTEKLFAKNGITLSEFSKKTGLSTKLISQIINKTFDKGFNELINYYRVDYAVQLIKGGYLDDFTIMSLSEKVGFNSRTTFFNAFKKEYGISPNEFWKKFRAEDRDEE
ncbi:AraC family transcriptional regulator [Belliella sp. DSM 111904]|uniref:AraC family transcriptional regulator n=1 Tax=Belliella filtrata TaxID=2923435 RepID=A0ABS9V515_9BACT|nr:AraC family transcriptional regulator [Belliella filtrata]MCH7411309.1 AraC family transcriptional regulator [Belliella filtrata]